MSTDTLHNTSFTVICPDCDAEWTMHIGDVALAGLHNTYDPTAITARFHKLEVDRPLARCCLCIFRGAGEP